MDLSLGVTNMPVLRTETKTIPAKIVETAVIGIPTAEWQSMCIKAFTAYATYFILMLCLITGMVVSMFILAPLLLKFWEVRLNMSYIMSLLMSAICAAGVFFPLAYLIDKLRKLSESFKPNLMKQHG